MYKIKSKRKKRSPLKAALLVVIILVLAAGVFAYFRMNNDDSVTESNNSESELSPEEEYINLNPPTDQEVQETEENKDSLSNGNGSLPTSSNGKKQVTPVIVYGDRTEIRADVPGIFEEEGTCTATATKNGQTKTASSSGFGNYNYTSCTPIKGLNLPDGGWSVVVSYNSNTSEGNSTPYVIN
jgi:cytoskeletal protein RodZ